MAIIFQQTRLDDQIVSIYQTHAQILPQIVIKCQVGNVPVEKLANLKFGLFYGLNIQNHVLNVKQEIQNFTSCRHDVADGRNVDITFAHLGREKHARLRDRATDLFVHFDPYQPQVLEVVVGQKRSEKMGDEVKLNFRVNSSYLPLDKLDRLGDELAQREAYDLGKSVLRQLACVL